MRILISLAWQEPQYSADNPNFGQATYTNMRPSKLAKVRAVKGKRKTKRKLPHDLYEQADLDMPRAERSGTAYEMPY